MRRAILGAMCVAATFGMASAQDGTWPVGLRERHDGRAVERTVRWNPKKTAIVIVDMWDDHHCRIAARRVGEMAPHMNDTLEAAREKGVFIIHSPSDCMDWYQDSPQRKRAQNAPFAKAPVKFQWNHFNPAREGPLEAKLERGGCSCGTPEPCSPSYRAWKRQTAAIDIGESDAISDDGQEVYNLLEQRGIDNVIVMGVHTNRCVLGRPFGIRQMAYVGKNVVLCRDLTDSYHRDPGKHFAGLDLIIQHIEEYWGPTSLVMGKHSGRHAFREKLKELGYELGDNAFEDAFVRFKGLADVKKHVYDEDIEALVDQEIASAQDRIRVTSLTVIAGTGGPQKATITLHIDDQQHMYEAVGDGPVDATFQAIRALVPHEARLALYQVSAVTEGTDAQAEVMVRLEADGKIATGRGSDTDTMVASARAYVSALNKLLAREARRKPETMLAS